MGPRHRRSRNIKLGKGAIYIVIRIASRLACVPLEMHKKLTANTKALWDPRQPNLVCIYRYVSQSGLDIDLSALDALLPLARCVGGLNYLLSVVLTYPKLPASPCSN